MKRYALHTLRCPLTGHALAVDAFRERQIDLSAKDVDRCRRFGIDPDEARNVIEEGVLISDSGIWYPIVNFVPVLLDFATPVHADFLERHRGAQSLRSHRPPWAVPRDGEMWVQRSFTAEWSLIGLDTISFGFSGVMRDAFVSLELDWPDDLLQRPLRVLEVGCGSGFESLSLDRVTGGLIFGYDLNYALVANGHHLSGLPFVNDGIASLFALPVPPKYFDLVYSSGVLHHTYSTREAFDAIVPYTANGGTIYVWLYSNEDYDRTIRQRINWSVEELVRPMIARLPARAQQAVVGALARRHYRTYMRSGRLGRTEWTYDDSEHAVRDRWTPLYAHRHSFKEIISWFRRLGMHYRLIDPTAYEDTVGVPLIGVGIRGVLARPDGVVGEEVPRRTALILATERQSTRRLADAAAALVAGGWAVEVAVPEDLALELAVPKAVRVSALSSRPPMSELSTPGALRFLRGTSWERLALNHTGLLGYALAHSAQVVVAFDLPSLPSAAIGASVHGSYLVYDLDASHAERIQFRDDGGGAFRKELEYALAPLTDLVTASSQALADAFAMRCAVDQPPLVPTAATIRSRDEENSSAELTPLTAPPIVPEEATVIQVSYDRLWEKPPRSLDALALAATRMRGTNFRMHNAARPGQASRLGAVPSRTFALELARRATRHARSKLMRAAGRPDA